MTAANEWVPRSERLGRTARVRTEHVHEHLSQAIDAWAEAVDLNEARCRIIALRLGLVPYDFTGESLLESTQADVDKYWDVVEGLLLAASDRLVRSLRQVLDLGSSSLTVSPDGQRIVDLVDSTMTTVAADAMSLSDDVSADLAKAWEHAYGRTPDPSDAWDHAIKALEGVLAPTVLPNEAKPTLGRIVGHLRSQGTQFRLVFPQNDFGHDVSALVTMLDQIWVNPDRHADGGTKRLPTLTEARAVVSLSAAIIQIARAGDLVTARPKTVSQ